MGCDIHLFKEKKINGAWVTADEWQPETDWDGEDRLECISENYGSRNYNLFGFLAKGVRRNHSKSFGIKGMPEDASTEVKEQCERWGCDGHSHSYLSLSELHAASAIVKIEKFTITGMMHAEQWELVQEESKKEDPNWDVIYPYCQMTNISGYVPFSIDVPMSFILGRDIDDIIANFEGIDGEDHRIVFWFDN